MKKEKMWNRATIVLIVLALVNTSVLVYCPQILHSNQASALYASSVFDKTKIMHVNIIMDDKDWDDRKKKFENMTEEEKEAMKQKFQGGNGGQQAAPVQQGAQDGQTTQEQQGAQATPGNNAEAQNEKEHNGGPGAGMGSDLAYSDDNYDSYDVIWDSSILSEVSDADKQRVITALKNISNKENVEDYLDVDQMLRYIAANVFVLNDDSYFGNMLHNYYLYENNGVLSMLPWDYNLAFGGFAMGANRDATSLVNRAIDDIVSICKKRSNCILYLRRI